MYSVCKVLISEFVDPLPTAVFLKGFTSELPRQVDSICAPFLIYVDDVFVDELYVIDQALLL